MKPFYSTQSCLEPPRGRKFSMGFTVVLIGNPIHFTSPQVLLLLLRFICVLFLSCFNTCLGNSSYFESDSSEFLAVIFSCDVYLCFFRFPTLKKITCTFNFIDYASAFVLLFFHYSLPVHFFCCARLWPARCRAMAMGAGGFIDYNCIDRADRLLGYQGRSLSS